MTTKVTKAALLAENVQLRALLAREMADKAAIQDRLNALLARRAPNDGYATFTEASAYAKQFGGVVRRAAESGRFIVVPPRARA